MQLERLLKQIEFIKEIDKLKYIQRKTKLFSSSRHENDAEHSWHLALMALVLSEHSNQTIDLLKVVKMVLIHDLVEIDAGDTFLFDATKNHNNTQEELGAAKRIFGMLPEDQALNLIQLWQEFEEGQSPEARFAKTLDRFQPVLQNLSNSGGTWVDYQVALDAVFIKIGSIEKGSSTLWEYTKAAIDESIEQGILKR